MKKIFLIPAMCLLCFACSRDNNYGNAQGYTQDQRSDWAITMRIKTAIRDNTSISPGASVAVNTTNGIVTLTGTVPTSADRNRIGRIARTSQGVVGVDNQIVVSNN